MANAAGWEEFIILHGIIGEENDFPLRMAHPIIYPRSFPHMLMGYCNGRVKRVLSKACAGLFPAYGHTICDYSEIQH